jgi:hypothetical protein
MDIGVAMFLMISFHVMLHNLFSPAFKNVVVSHKMNFSPEWLQKLEAILATTHPHHLSPAWSNWFGSC